MVSFKKHAPGQIKYEVDGLNALNQVVRTPKIIKFDDNDLEIERINSTSSSSKSDILTSEALHRLHRVTNDKFGWHSDNYIGSTPQINTWRDNWADFFIEDRLDYQMSLPGCSSLISEWKQSRETMYGILENVTEPPSLTHGDLWAGNLLIDSVDSSPVFIDPAVSYSHRETDLAMMKLFGGFSSNIFSHYMELWPLCDGYVQRNDIYQLYHILNHLNIFGSSYKHQAQQILQRYST